MMADLVVTLSGNEAKLYQAMQRIIDQQGGVEKGFQKVKRASKDASDNLKNDSKANQSALASIEKNIVGIGASYLSFSAAIALASNAVDAIIQKQQKSHSLWKDAAKPQEDALKNFTGMDPKVMTEILTSDVPSIARDQGFPDTLKLIEAFGAGYSAVPDEEALRKAVKFGAGLNRANPDQLPIFVAATMDMVNASGIKDPSMNAAALLTAGKASRVEDPAKFYQNAAKAAGLGALNNPLMDAETASRQALALLGRFTALGVDKTGDTSVNALANFEAGISNFFKGREDDPIDLFKRIELLQQRDDLRKSLWEHPFGSMEVRPIFESMLGVDQTEKSRKVWADTIDAYKEISFSPSIAMEKVQQVESLTPQLSVATSEAKVSGAIEARKYMDAPGALRTSIAKLGSEAMNATSSGIAGYFGDTFATFQRGMLLAQENNSIGPAVLADLRQRQASLLVGDQTPDVESKLAILSRTIEEVGKMTKALQEATKIANDLAAAKREEVAATRTAAKQRNAGSIREE